MMKKYFAFTILLITIITISGSAQIIEKRLNTRKYAAVVKEMNSFNQFFGLPIADLYLYAYDKILSEWRAVPFQIDERNSAKKYFGINDDGLVDQYDELVFLARDAGDKVPDGYWLADLFSRNTFRLEIEIQDTLRVGQRGWVYLFYSKTINDYNTEDYIGHSFEYALIYDKIISKYYEVHFWTRNGMPAYAFITQAGGGTGVNAPLHSIIDRFKIRITAGDIKAYGFSLSSITVDEEDLYREGTPQIIDKKVRIIRNLRIKIQKNIDLPWPLPDYTYQGYTDITIYFYPFNYNIQSGNISLNTDDVPNVDMKIKLIRTSMDFNKQNANGMIFYNKYIRNSPDASNSYANLINGLGGSLLDSNELQVPGLNWFLISGNPGSYFSTTMVPDIGDQHKTYYYDYQYGGSMDGTTDTGANGSWGDSGIAITGSDIQGEFKLLIDTYFLPANQTVTAGDTINDNIENPVDVSVVPQLYDIIPPAKITTIAWNPESANAVTLTWIAPGDDNNLGKANRYEIAYSSTAPQTGQEENWFNTVATKVTGVAEPQNAGIQESLTVNGLSRVTQYFFAIRTYDESNDGIGNKSPLSDIVSTLTLDVELISFTAEPYLQSVKLYWQTASEDNNYGFDLQRKKESEFYETVAFIPGNGTTTELHSYSFLDTDVTPGKYYYRLKQIDLDGSDRFYNEISALVAPPLQYALHQNYPNPFNATTTLKYDLAEDTQVKLVIYNTKGQVIKVAVDGFKTAGQYKTIIDGSRWPSGIYFARLTAGSYSFVNKMILLE